MKKYLSIKDIAEYEKYPFTKCQISTYMTKRYENGLHKATIKIGKRLYLREDLFDEWLDSHLEIPIIIPKKIKIIDNCNLKDTKINESEKNIQLDYGIDKLQLSYRAENCLKELKIKTLRKLITFTEKDLCKCKKLGKKCLSQIKERLEERGLKLKEKD